ncbi:DUF4157 domain-containing protein [Microcoleus sp. FACHB-831]|uniref:eCIS core domain-containing protein n=1 Tax=Microcoleus sp. FACHB-831 TaxID=2692827 RepID=UPI00168487F5|nr:DUF4157 domain-containing protein [Microcoleus sp. FACHB-831]MBD1920028.1 DUF4157 domain-containing protein [Microcoleus sp. FACHB-831]
MDSRTSIAKTPSTDAAAPAPKSLFGQSAFESSQVEEREVGPMASRPFASPTAPPIEPPPPNLQARYDGASRFGHNFGNIAVSSPGAAYPETPVGIQAKLAVGKPGDRYEVEADAMADKVMAMQDPAGGESVLGGKESPQPLQRNPIAHAISQHIQRHTANTAIASQTLGGMQHNQEPGLLQRAPIHPFFAAANQQTPQNLQLKRQVLQPVQLLTDAPDETEDTLVNRNSEEEESEVSLQRKEEATQGQGDVEAESLSQELDASSLVQRAPVAGAKNTGGDIEGQLNNSKGGGSALGEEVRDFMEPRFGNDFSDVRIHTGGDAVQMNKDLHAQAFAHGKDIYFNQGKYNPGSDDGKRLLAHELTHVVQQTGAVQPKSGIGLAAKENKVQLKASSTPSNYALEAIQLKGNPHEQAGGEKTVQPAEPAAAASPASPAGEKGAQGKAPTAEGGGVAKANKGEGGGTTPAKGGASKGEGGGATLAKGGAEKAESNLASVAPTAKGGTQQAASGGGSSSASGGGGAKSAQDDPAFQAVVNKTKKVASSEKKHEPAAAKSKQAQAAAEPPSNEVESKAQDKQVAEMNQQQPGTFNAATFKAALMQKIAAVTPQTLEEADNFKNNNKIDSVKGELSSSVTDEKKQASGPIEEKTKEQPDASGIKPKPVTPLTPEKAGSPPSNIGAEKAAPKPKSASEVSLQEGSKSLDQQMSEANVSEEQLASSNEPQFKSALTAKKTAQTDAKTAPQGYRQQEQGILKQAQAEAQTTAQTQLQGMHGDREQLLAGVVGLQGEAKGQDEQKRTDVANHLGSIYNATKQKVETTLSQLDGEVNKQFDQGAATAKTQFENYVDQRMKRYKDERYSGATGFLKWGKDKLFGMPDAVNVFYEEGRDIYLASMGKAIDNIASFVARTLNTAKAEIAKGKQEIQKYVAGLDPSLRQVGQEAAQEIGSKFDELEQNVDNKQNELIDTLAQKYNENLQQIDSRIDEMKAANRGLVNKALDAVGGVIKTILELKNLLMGVLAKAAGAIANIIKDPIGFLGNLVSGLKQGFQNFMGNILEHLKKGMLGWLTGAMAGAGITMPESLDMKGIFSLVTQVLGTVYENIRPRAVKRMGEKAVNFLESNFEMFVILKNEGIAGLWQSIQDQVGDLKVMVIDNIQNFVVDGIIKGGVMWVLSLLNPASAFVKACKAIYDIIMFFIERGSQIAELVNAVMESVTAIASGAVGGAAKLVENALSKALPVVISFMASLLGLGGISEKIQAIVQKVRGPIEKAIDWVIAQAVTFAKKIGGKLGFGKDKKGKDNKEDKSESEKKHAEMGNAAAQQLAKKPSQEMPYEEIRASKEKEAKMLEDKYNKELEKPVKMTITFKSQEEDKKDGDMDFHIHIGPNDYDDDVSLDLSESGKTDHAANWEEVQKVINKEVGVQLPEGYIYVYKREGKQLIRRLKVDDNLYQRLTVNTVDGKDIISLGKAKSNRISKSGELTKNLKEDEEARGDTNDYTGHQSHHLIPDAVVRDHPLTKAARERGEPPYNLDDATNGIRLPSKDQSRRNSPKLPPHKGSHPDWNKFTQKKLDSNLNFLIRNYGSLENVRGKILTDVVKKIERQLRAEIKSWRVME